MFEKSAWQVLFFGLLLCQYISCMEQQKKSILGNVLAERTCAFNVPSLRDLSIEKLALIHTICSNFSHLPFDLQKKIDDYLRIKRWYQCDFLHYSQYDIPDYCLASVAWSDSDNIAAGSCTKQIFLFIPYNVRENNVVSIDGHDSTVQAVNFYHDNSKLISGSYDKKIKLWDIEMQQAINTMEETDPVRALALHPCHPLLASCADEYFTFWDIRTHKYIIKLNGHSDSIFALDYHQGGNLFASGSADQSIKIWDVRFPTNYIHHYTGYDSSIYSIKFSPLQQILFSASDKGVHRRNLLDSSVKKMEEHKGQKNASTGVISLSCHPKENVLAWDYRNKSINILNLDTETVVNSIPSEFEGPGILDLAFSADGAKLAAVSAGLEIWEPFVAEFQE